MVATTNPNVLNNAQVEINPNYDQHANTDHAANLAAAISALNMLSMARANNYDEWLKVGEALHFLGDDGLNLWEAWSKQSVNYQYGKCAQQWATFTTERIAADNVTFFSLLDWAQVDGNIPHVQPCPPRAKPSDYKNAIRALGIVPALNAMNDEIFINGVRMTDPLEARIINSLREHGYKSEAIANDCLLEMALDNQFHPIQDYLNSLTWNGVDYISQLGSFFHDEQDIFSVLLRKWLIGAVGRVLKPEANIQNPVLVLDGPQGIGKSWLAWWLCSPLPTYYAQTAIVAGDKDSLIRLCSTFVWELGELGTTFKRSDIESLKAFITTPMVTVRAPYGHRDMHKRPTASFIGTINNISGFLADPTGNRRYRSCTLKSIDWDYDKNIDINNIWAQAVALFLSGETNELDSRTQSIVNEVNTGYEIDDPIAYSIFSAFSVDPKEKSKTTPTAEIIRILRGRGDIVSGNDKQIAMQIASVLVKAGCKNKTIRVNGQQVRAWIGVWI